MAMSTRRHGFPDLSGDEAIAALRWLVARGKIQVADITDALRRREELVAEIKGRLEELGGEGLRFLRRSDELALRRRRPKQVSAAARAAWRAKKRYLAAVRRLSKADRAKVEVIREKSGMQAAVAEAKRIARAP